MKYINWKYQGKTETIDEAKTQRDAVYLRHEYTMAYGGLGRVYISQRPCGEWCEPERNPNNLYGGLEA